MTNTQLGSVATLGIVPYRSTVRKTASWEICQYMRYRGLVTEWLRCEIKPQFKSTGLQVLNTCNYRYLPRCFSSSNACSAVVYLLNVCIVLVGPYTNCMHCRKYYRRFSFLLALQPNSDLGRLHEILSFTSVGRTPWTDDQLVARSLLVHEQRKIHTQYKH
jgi:hypothetical protein